MINRYCMAALALFATGGAATAQAPDPDTQASFVRLTGDGLAAGQPGLHAYASFRFGISRAEATRSVADLSGGVSATGVSRNCGARPLAFARVGTLTLYFRNQRFVGWSLAGPRARRPVETEWGTGIGARRHEVAGGDMETPVFRRTARGTEFDADGMHGLMSPGPRGRVTAIWAGETCRGR